MAFESDAPRPAWAIPETAWFLALAGGVLATWAGTLFGLPGLGPAFGAVFATVYQAVLHRHRLHGAAGMVAGAGILGVLVATIGLVLELGWPSARPLFPGADLYVREATGPLVLAAGAGAGSWSQTGLAALAIGVGLLLARPTRGLAPMLGAALFAGILGIAAPAAAAAGVPDETSVLLCLHSVPPWALLQLVGLVLVSSVLASEEPILPLDELPEARRRLLLVGLPAIGLGLLLQPVLAGAWGAWVPTA